MSAFLELRGIEATLGRFRLAVDFECEGGITAIFGPSGAGKTTLLEIIAGLRQPDGGRVIIDGETLSDADRKIQVRAAQRRIGYVPQDLALFPHMTVRRNIEYGMQEERPPGISFEDVTRVLEIEKLTGQFPGPLSGGEKQRVAFARALMIQPRLLLLDEPLAGLDAELKERILPYLTRIHGEFRIPILYVTHSANEVAALCDAAILLREGRVGAQGSTGALFERSTLPQFRLRTP